MANKPITTYSAAAGSLVRRGPKIVPPPPPPPGSFLNPDVTAGAAPIGSMSYPLPTFGGIFVNPVTGSDAASGGADTPYKTFAKAASVAKSGDTIVLRGGTYHEGKVGTASVYTGIAVTAANVTIQNYPGEAVWFDGSSAVTGWVFDTTAVPGVNVWRKDGWGVQFDRSPTFSFGAADDTRPGWGFVDTANYPCAAWPDQVFVDGVNLQQVNTLAKLGPGKFYVDYATSKLFIGTNPTNHEVRASDLQTAVSIGATGCVVRGIGFRRYAPSMPHIGAVKVYRSNCIFENVEVSDCATIGLSVQTGSGITLNNVTANNNGCLGVHSNNADDMVLYRVRAEWNNREHFNYAPAEGGIKLTRQRRTLIKECVASNNYGKGIWIDESVYDTKIVGCNINGNEQRGVVVEISGGLHFVNNLVCNNGFDGLVVFNISPPVEIWNNTIVGNGRLAPTDSRFTEARNVAFFSDNRMPMVSNSVGRDTRYPYPDTDGMDWIITNNVVKNNIIAKINTSGQALLGIEDYNKSTGASRSWTAYGLQWDGNFYNWVTQPKYPWLVPNAGSANVTVLFSIAAVRTLTGQDTNSTLVAGTDGVNADYTLAAAQVAAHGKAVPIPGPIATLANQPTNTRHVGAWR